jgi:hypothetical protein
MKGKIAMNFIEHFTDLKKREQEIRNELESLRELQDTIEHDDWVFCLHTHYDEPRVSFWRSGDDYNSDDSAEVMIKDGCVELYDAGVYWEYWQRHEIGIILDQWLSGEVGSNFMERFADLKKQEQEIRNELESLRELGLTIDRDDWRFCLHTHYDEPRVSFWRSGGDYNSDGSAEIMIKDGCVELYDAGMYQEEWHEIKNILDEWLLKGATMKGEN